MQQHTPHSIDTWLSHGGYLHETASLAEIQQHPLSGSALAEVFTSPRADKQPASSAAFVSDCVSERSPSQYAHSRERQPCTGCWRAPCPQDGRCCLESSALVPPVNGRRFHQPGVSHLDDGVTSPRRQKSALCGCCCRSDAQGCRHVASTSDNCRHDLPLTHQTQP